MALPKPNYSFTIPSVHDDTLLDCRLYHPKQQHESDLAVHRTKAAIVAHPYAPLGGSYDDPVVASIGKTLLSAGYIVGTFNFRGGGGSAGRTSWSAKPELADYVSFYSFMLSYLSAIHPSGHEIPLLTEQPASGPIPANPPDQENVSPEARQRIRLVLAGYSYGSMIASHLPPINAVLNTFRTPPSDSAAAEISLRASTMARLRNKDVQSRRSRKNEPQSRGRSSLRVADAGACPGGSSSSHAVSVGGFESEPTSRRISRESARRSLDVGCVRQSIDRVRERFASRQDGSSNSNNTNPNIDHDTNPAETETTAAIPPSIQLQPPEIEVCYLLISPLLPPVASFTTMFSTLSYLTAPTTTTTTELTLHPSLAIYGTKDTFTSRRKLRKWAEQLQQKAKSGGSRFEFCEVEGAGHFWHEGDAVERMMGAVSDWLGRLDAPLQVSVGSNFVPGKKRS